MLEVNAKLLLIASWFCDTDKGAIMRKVLLREKYSDMLAHLDQHLDAKLTVERLASDLGMSRHQLSKMFRRDFGISLKSYLGRLLLYQASEKILSGMKVKDAANALGFGSEFYFSRFFKKHVGVPPTQYQSGRLFRSLDPASITDGTRGEQR